MYKLGKKPARPDAVKLAFSQFFTAHALPTPPLVFGHYQGVAPFGVLANDEYGDCVWAGAAHETMFWAHEGGAIAHFTDADVLSDYSAVTGFDPARPDTDQGTDMQEAASYRRKTGIIDANNKRHLIDSYLALRPGDANQLALAAYILGAAAVGLKYPDSADKQFDDGQPWDVVKGAQTLGGHYVPCIGRNSHGQFLVVTWGRIHAMTPAFYEAYCDEALAYVSLETLKLGKTTAEGFDAGGLRNALKQITQQGNKTMTEPKIEGTRIDPDEVAAVKAAVVELADKTPGMMLYRHLLSDAVLQQVAQAAVAASVQYRNAPSL